MIKMKQIWIQFSRNCREEQSEKLKACNIGKEISTIKNNNNIVLSGRMQLNAIYTHIFTRYIKYNNVEDDV